MSRLFSNRNLDLLAHLLDDRFRIPGSSIRFGLDGVIGLLPAAGDAVAGLASCILIVAAWTRGAPAVTLARMTVNVAIDVLVGAIPVLGDAFDVYWKANRRNYALLSRRLDSQGKGTWKDWLFLLLLFSTLAGILVAPLAALAWFLAWLR